MDLMRVFVWIMTTVFFLIGLFTVYLSSIVYSTGEDMTTVFAFLVVAGVSFYGSYLGSKGSDV